MLSIEQKVDSAEKAAAIAGKPTENYLFAEEVNEIVNAVNTLEENVENLANNKQDNLNENNLGAIANGLTTEDDIQDSDKFNFTDTSDANKQKKTSWLNIKAKIVAVIDNLFVPKTRTLTIGGVTHDLSDNRTFAGGGKRVQIISDCSSWQLNANLFFVTTESVNGVGWNSGNTFKSSQPGATSNAISLITNAFVIPIGISAYNSNLKKLVLEARHSYYRPNDRFLIGYYQKNSASPVTHINPTIIYDNIVPYGETIDGTYVVLNINSNILIPENAMIVYAIASNDATAAATVNKFYCLTTQIILEEI